jgi:hypothetical protein
MNRSAAELEREVESSRAHLESTVEALKEKMTLGEMVDEASRYFRDSGGAQMVSNLGAQVRDNPLPLLLVGVGLAWLMSGRGRPHMRSHDSSSEYFDDEPDFFQEPIGRYDPGYRSLGAGNGEGHSESGGIGEAFSKAGSGISDAVGQAGAAISGAVEEVGSSISGAASSASDAASSLGRSASRFGRSAASTAGSFAGSARSGATAARRGASHLYRDTTHLGASAYGSAARMGSGISRSVTDILDREPLVLGALGLAVGAAVGALLPRTEIEDRYIGEASDKLRHSAETLAREKLEQGKSVARAAYESGKSEAQSQGPASTNQA